MRDLFVFKDGRLEVNEAPKGKSGFAEYIHEQCNIPFDAAVDVGPIAAELCIRSVYKALTRGKFLFWFLIKFCDSIHQSAALFFPSVGGVAKGTCRCPLPRAWPVVGTRARIPPSLRTFLEAMFCMYVKAVSG